MRPFWFYMPFCYHAACYIGLLLSESFASLNYFMGFLFLADIVGIMLVPLYLAVVSVINAFVTEKSVFSSFLKCSVIVLIVGAARAAVYCIGNSSALWNCLQFTLYTFVILIVWFLLFELTNYLMHRKRRF
ncbi:MAG: hypothetical protein Q4C12_00540 [Clostridia bacterium]|nr:hypothetical protein [Clostridia bacterium]